MASANMDQTVPSATPGPPALRLVHDADAARQSVPPAPTDPGEDVFDGVVEIALGIAARLRERSDPMADAADELCLLLETLRKSYRDRGEDMRLIRTGLAVAADPPAYAMIAGEDPRVLLRFFSHQITEALCK